MFRALLCAITGVDPSTLVSSSVITIHKNRCCATSHVGDHAQFCGHNTLFHLLCVFLLVFFWQLTMPAVLVNLSSVQQSRPRQCGSEAHANLAAAALTRHHTSGAAAMPQHRLRKTDSPATCGTSRQFQEFIFGVQEAPGGESSALDHDREGFDQQKS